MSTLSFVAVSLQTTHLDPATVSKISYAKLVEGEITRIGSIEIIPSTLHNQQAEQDDAETTEALAWPEALKNFSMIVGRLPLVSYYRDADKEIFQAASQLHEHNPSPLHWLDGRAIVEQLHPEFQEYQLPSVLQTLNLHEQYGTSSTSVQTAQVVLALAQRHEKDSIEQLWGELYHQPDDHLELPFTMESGGVVTQPETGELGVVDVAPTAEEPPEDHEPVAAQTVDEELNTDSPDEDELPAVTVPVTPELDEGQEQPEFLKVPLPEDLEPASNTEPAEDLDVDESDVPVEDHAVEGQVVEDQTISSAEPEGETSDVGQEQPEFLKVPLPEDLEPAPKTEPAGGIDEDEIDVPVKEQPVKDQVVKDQAVEDETISSAVPEGETSDVGQEQPEFLKVPLPEDLELASKTEPAGDPDEDGTDVPVDDQPVKDQVVKDEVISPAEPESETPDEGAETHTDVEEAQETTQDEDSTPVAGTETDEKPQEEPVDDTPAHEESAVEAELTDAEPVEAPHTEAVESEATEESAQQHPVLAETASKKTSSVGRVFALLGLIIFGLLTVAGVVVTVMAGFQFVVPNTLMFETKIAGVLLTGTLTLLSLLMATVCYQKLRKK